jgi:hypothetical protein
LSDADAAAALDRFAARLAAHPWFSVLGEPPTDAEEADARAYVEGMGAGDFGIAWAGDLNAAAALLQRADHAPAWMAAEAAEVQRLSSLANAALGEVEATDRLNRVMHRASDAAMGPAAVACVRAGIASEALPRVAAGSAAQAAHGMALVVAAKAGERHPFAARFSLFAGGRWPLGAAGGRFHLL